MADLTHTIEVALGGTLTDVTSLTRGFTCGGGRQSQFDTFQTGTCSFELADVTGDYIPGGGGLWTAETWIGREVVVTVTSGGIENVIWRGHVEDIDVDFSERNFARISVDAVEPLAILARTSIDVGTAFSSELSTVRLENVLGLAEAGAGYFTSSTKNIVDGETTLQAETDAGGNTLEYLQRVATSEGGRLFVRHGQSPGGVLAFRPRSSTSSDLGVTFQADDASSPRLVTGGTSGTVSWGETFDGGDASSSMVDALDGGDASTRYGVEFQRLKVGYGSDVLANRATFTREGGAVQTAEDVKSQERYGVRPVTASGLLNATDADVLELAELRLARSTTPGRNVEALSVVLDGASDDQAAMVCQLTVGDQVKVSYTPPGTVAVAPTVSTVRIEHVQHRAVPGTHSVEFRLTTLSDEFGGAVDGGDASTVSFVSVWDGGDATSAVFAGSLDGGSAIFV